MPETRSSSSSSSSSSALHPTPSPTQHRHKRGRGQSPHAAASSSWSSVTPVAATAETETKTETKTKTETETGSPANKRSRETGAVLDAFGAVLDEFTPGFNRVPYNDEHELKGTTRPPQPPFDLYDISAFLRKLFRVPVGELHTVIDRFERRKVTKAALTKFGEFSSNRAALILGGHQQHYSYNTLHYNT